MNKGINVEIPKGYLQVLVAEGVTEPKNQEEIDYIENALSERLGCKVKYLETILTLPTKINGIELPDTGGRSDLLIVLEKDYPMSVAIKRLQFGLRWLEDVIANNLAGEGMIHPERIKEYQSWDATIPFDQKQ